MAAPKKIMPTGESSSSCTRLTLIAVGLSSAQFGLDTDSDDDLMEIAQNQMDGTLTTMGGNGKTMEGMSHPRARIQLRLPLWSLQRNQAAVRRGKKRSGNK